MSELAGVERVRYVIVGAGVHGLSTAWNLARELRTRGQGDGSDVVVVDKTGVAAGASGIACGVIRNNYFQPAMRRLMAHSVAVWDSDPRAFSYHPVGYLQAAPEVMRAGVAQIYAEQQEIGYASTLVEGEDACRTYLRDLLGDWQAPGITNVLHERRGGYANNQASIHGLAAKAEAEGVRIVTGVQVTGFDIDGAGDGAAVSAVHTDGGTIGCEQVVIAVGPWVKDLWAMLDLPSRVDVRDGQGNVHRDVDMWTYLYLQEGTLGVDPGSFTDTRGNLPPVIHVDSDAPLLDEHGDLVTDEMWGIYYKPDFSFGGVQGGAMPVRVEKSAADVTVDPYGPASTEYTAAPGFARMWTSALAHCQQRFEGTSHLYKQENSGGLGCFTPDSFPVFDTFRQNAYVIADSNHGYKMIGVGALVARELLGDRQDLLDPFRFTRYQRGDLHPTSSSPFPWS
ncbi:MAG: putative monomeric sarcosine oxidase [uncultured Nocardioidaceae bacterium]|uniref:Putative monomeric sarcosine oxidase n=1 Tax=uncultured Nocardioidaceae bacterium TaxID=253824 RepID=A0A6J4MTW9_9ACTN|nr:MAG: putative monomeric sarcosine oxidase [uncultured Nocardioidaceae bacterium]